MARLKTVIAQQSNHGSIHVLAAFASEGMGLRRHVETVVRPWLTANTRWALNNHRLLLGAYEDVEQQNEFDLLQVVEDLLGAIGKNREAGGKAGATACYKRHRSEPQDQPNLCPHRNPRRICNRCPVQPGRLYNFRRWGRQPSWNRGKPYYKSNLCV